MNRKKHIPLYTAMIILCHHYAFPQFSGLNQASFQVGNQPAAKPQNQNSLYNQLNIRYTQENFTLGLRAETYQISTPAEYSVLSQNFVRFNSDNLQMQAGNFHEILGRGLLLRSFEIPGSIYEVAGQRYGFYKDIEGLSIRYQNAYFSSKFLYGRPLDRSLPPSFGEKERRPAIVYGSEINFLVFENFTPGLIYLKRSITNESATNSDDTFYGLNVESLLSENIQFYTEYSTNAEPVSNNDFFERSQAFYTSASIGLDAFYISGEYKYYNNFLLIFNDPPPTVREHSFTLLNRSTHVMNLTNESGYQLEVLYNFDDYNTITFNHTWGVNDINMDKDIYQSFYLDLNYYLSNESLLKTFIDYAMDESEFRKDQYTLGALLEYPIIDLWSVSFEAQYQQFNYDLPLSPFLGNLDQDIENGAINLFVSRSSKFSAGASLELSNDNRETDPNFTKDKDIFISWPSLNVSYQYNQHNTFSLFYGKRRGGNACTGGVCYQVLPFEGLELKLNSRF